MVTIKRYSEEDKTIWNIFNTESKNYLFMFDRGFMDYHKDRFKDHSLMFYNGKNELVAILPLSENENILTSHGGLTYGGFIMSKDIKQHTVNDCFNELCKYSKENGFTNIYYKTIPHMYHKYPAEEDRYSLFINNATLVRVEPATVINLKQALKITKGRKGHISRAKREGVKVVELHDEKDFIRFIDLQNKVLKMYHNTKAVHTGEELVLLHNRFPENIRLFGAFKDSILIAGIVAFEYEDVVHTQYLASDEQARRIGGLDLVVYNIIEKYKSTKNWLDFGISTENGGLYLNEGLISQKEGFGGRTNIYEMWEIKL